MLISDSIGTILKAQASDSTESMASWGLQWVLIAFNFFFLLAQWHWEDHPLILSELSTCYLIGTSNILSVLNIPFRRSLRDFNNIPKNVSIEHKLKFWAAIHGGEFALRRVLENEFPGPHHLGSSTARSGPIPQHGVSFNPLSQSVGGPVPLIWS